MFDCSGPQLVFDTHCHGADGQFTGYIFALYDVWVYKPRELFFSHIAEAQLFALQTGAVFLMNPKSKPERLGIDQFVSSGGSNFPSDAAGDYSDLMHGLHTIPQE